MISDLPRASSQWTRWVKSNSDRLIRSSLAAQRASHWSERGDRPADVQVVVLWPDRDQFVALVRGEPLDGFELAFGASGVFAGQGEPDSREKAHIGEDIPFWVLTGKRSRRRW
jgi:hypothetical protein